MPPSTPTPDLLLAHGYFLEEDEKERAIMKPYVPLGILYVAAYLERAGMDVEVFDTTFRRRQDLVARLRRGRPSVLGLSANLMTRANVVALAREARAAGWKVVLGGPEPANWAAEYLTEGADAIVEGEGEATMAELVPVLANHGADPERLGRVAGLVFRGADGAVARTPERERIADIDALPWPARARVDIGRYLETWRRAHGMGSLSLITARGCPYKCNWCSHGVYGFSHRRRSPAAVAEEVAHLVAAYRPEMLWYADDVFNIKPRWLTDFAAEMEARKLRVPFECICRADRMNEEAADALARLGCLRVWIGSESGSQRILDAMERGVTVAQVRDATALLRRHKIETGMFLMWGYEGEEMADIDATVEHVKQSAPDVFFTTVSYPIKGTKYHDLVAARAVPSRAWAEGSDRDVAISRRHSRRFYDWASTYLRHEVAYHRLKGAPRSARNVLLMGRSLLASRLARRTMARLQHEIEAP